MSRQVLITGGAGFIGSHLAHELLQHGYRVRVLDNLSPPAHGLHAVRPAHLCADVELIVGDVRNLAAVRQSLAGVDAVVHLAALVGSGPLSGYTSVNNLGTTVLLEALIEHPVERLIVASSASIYGEGMYRTPHGTLVMGQERSPQQLQERQWELATLRGTLLDPAPTPETKTPAPSSLYAFSKYEQERVCLLIGNAHTVPTVALRLFHVFGPYQTPTNPYTGMLNAWAARLLSGARPIVPEDGSQQRDFVSVYDAVRAFRLALERPKAAYQVINVGSGQPVTLGSLAAQVASLLDREHLQPEASQEHQPGDIRHCFADISRARNLLGYVPAITLDAGLAEWAEYIDRRVVDEDAAMTGLAVREAAA